LPQEVEPTIVGDIGAATDWRLAVEETQCIIHLAARVHMMRDDAADPLAAFRSVNVEGTRRLAEAAASVGVSRFIFVSSIKAIAEEGEGLNETAEPGPVDPYGRSKLEAERALTQIAAQSGMALFVLRPPLVYGPGVRGNFRRLLDILDRGWPLPLGGFRNSRSLVYVGNLADAITRCVSAPPQAQGTYLLHDGEPLSTPELARRIASALGKPARLLPIPAGLLSTAARLLRKEQAWKRLTGSLTVDDRALRDALGWAPPYTVDEGLRATAAWYRGLARAR
jgi:nucleoside-diphosphate-sugar epimerase